MASLREVALVDGADPTAEWLLEMGLTPGVRVRVIGTTPLGCPVELEVRGYRLSIRKSDAARIAVSPASESAAPARRPVPR